MKAKCVLFIADYGIVSESVFKIQNYFKLRFLYALSCCPAVCLAPTVFIKSKKFKVKIRIGCKNVFHSQCVDLNFFTLLSAFITVLPKLTTNQEG